MYVNQTYMFDKHDDVERRWTNNQVLDRQKQFARRMIYESLVCLLYLASLKSYHTNCLFCVSYSWNFTIYITMSSSLTFASFIWHNNITSVAFIIQNLRRFWDVFRCIRSRASRTLVVSIDVDWRVRYKTTEMKKLMHIQFDETKRAS